MAKPGGPVPVPRANEVKCRNCGHPRYLHEMTNGYQPYGHCNHQWDLCGCTNFEPEIEDSQQERKTYTYAQVAQKFYSGSYDHLTGKEFRELFPLAEREEERKYG